MTTKKESAQTGTKNADSAKTKVVKLDPQQDIKSQIDYFNLKHDLIKRRYRFEATKSQLLKVELKEDDNGEFEKKDDDIKITLKQGYNSELLSVSNRTIVKEFVDFMAAKIDAKIQELDKLILS